MTPARATPLPTLDEQVQDVIVERGERAMLERAALEAELGGPTAIVVPLSARLNSPSSVYADVLALRVGPNVQVYGEWLGAPVRARIVMTVGAATPTPRLSDDEIAKRDALLLCRGVYEPTAQQRRRLASEQNIGMVVACTLALTGVTVGIVLLAAGVFEADKCNAFLNSGLVEFCTVTGLAPFVLENACIIAAFLVMLMAPLGNAAGLIGMWFLLDWPRERALTRLEEASSTTCKQWARRVIAEARVAPSAVPAVTTARTKPASGASGTRARRQSVAQRRAVSPRRR